MAQAHVLNFKTGSREENRKALRQAIITAAKAEFSEKGYAAMSMSHLIKRLGGSKATMWRHFGSKEDLFAAVLEDVSDSFELELQRIFDDQKAQSLRSGLREFATAMLTKMHTAESMAIWRMMISESARFPELSRLFYEKAGSVPETYLKTFLARFEGKELCTGGADALAEMMLGLCTNHLHRQFFFDCGDQKEPFDVAATRFADILLQQYILDAHDN